MVISKYYGKNFYFLLRDGDPSLRVFLESQIVIRQAFVFAMITGGCIRFGLQHCDESDKKSGLMNMNNSPIQSGEVGIHNARV
jgi:hypothetical protein